MKHNRNPFPALTYAYRRIATLYIQAPLPCCLKTLPKLTIVAGQGSGRQGPSPLAPLEEPAND